MGLEGSIPPEARIPVNPREHKIPIAIHFSILFTTSAVLPVILYFIFKYAAHLDHSIYVSVPTAIFGAIALFSLSFRFWSLGKKNSTTRPLGGTRWQFDYFQWNFLCGFIYITVLISVGSSLNDPATSIRVIGMSQPLLLYQVCVQMLVAYGMHLFGIRYPFRFSSMPKGAVMRGATYTIVEDIMAVDAKQGTDRYRRPFDARWEASTLFQQHMRRMDLIWGVSGTAVATVLIVLIWTLHNAEISYALGFLVPWGWVAVFSFVSIKMTDNMLKREAAYFTSFSRHSSDSA